MILNNVLSTDPTQIDGMLSSNGQVWIANPVGVFFGDQAIVDVGRLVAAAGNVDAGEFLAGTERFSQLTGRVEVGAGAQIRAADSVLLVGAAVANYGNISTASADGMIALVAGGEVRLARVDGRVIVTADRAIAPDPERWGVVQAGELDAGAVASRSPRATPTRSRSTTPASRARTTSPSRAARAGWSPSRARSTRVIAARARPAARSR
jgi:large exoprotein involved in heme utilization and adhesion